MCSSDKRWSLVIGIVYSDRWMYYKRGTVVSYSDKFISISYHILCNGDIVIIANQNDKVLALSIIKEVTMRYSDYH